MPIRSTATEPKQVSTPTKPPSKGKGSAVLALFVLFLLVAGGFVWSYNGYVKTKKELALLKDPKLNEENVKKETDQLIVSLSKLVVLPEGETPTVATITDAVAMAKEQPFYKDAHNGDKLLVYTQARKAYIFDPNRNILVNVGPIYVDENTQTPTASSTTESRRLNIEVRNGSNTAGKGTLLANELKKIASFNVTSAISADNKDYQGVVIVDLTAGVKAEEIKALADKLGAKVASALPAGECTSDAEAIVIAGN